MSCKCKEHQVCECVVNKLDLTKPVQTRDGRSARILTTNRKHKSHSVVALISIDVAGDEFEVAYCYKPDGSAYDTTTSMQDLVNVPRKIKGWVNLYKYGKGSFSTGVDCYETKEDAVKGSSYYDPDSYLGPVYIEKEIS